MHKLNIRKFQVLFGLLFAVVFIGACQSTSPSEETSETPKTTAEEKSKAIDEGETILKGTFQGKSDHKTSGKVLINKTSKGHLLILEADFEFDGAPDPNLAFGKGGYKKETAFSLLKKNKGRQVYKIPDSIDPTEFDEAWLWCKKFNVALGMTKLS